MSSHSHEATPPMNEYESLATRLGTANIMSSSSPECRRKTLYQESRRHLAEVFRRLALQKEMKVEEGASDARSCAHAVSIPPKYAVRRWWGFHQGQRAYPHGRGLWRAANAISWGSTSGRRALSSTRSGAMRKPSAPTFGIKRRKDKRLEQTNLGADKRLGRLQIRGAASVHPFRRSSGPQSEAPGFAGDSPRRRTLSTATWGSPLLLCGFDRRHLAERLIGGLKRPALPITGQSWSAADAARDLPIAPPSRSSSKRRAPDCRDRRRSA